MATSPHRCDPSRPGLFLADLLTEADRAAFAEHLDDCEDCRRALESLAADGRAWEDVRLLAGSPRPAAPMAREGGDGTGEIGHPGHEGPIAAGPPDVEPEWLALLDPPGDPRHLGLLGPYEITGVLGRGGMGIVFRGRDPALDRVVAIKVLAPQLATDEIARRRFAREAQAAAAVAHENVVPIHSVDRWKGLPYLVMPYIAGRSLQDRIDEAGPLEIGEVLRIGIQAARGLAAAHAQGLVHRDVKPSNVLLDSGAERARLTDFGLARAVDDATLTRTGVVAGTPQYMAPEQAKGGPVDARADLFSLGSVLYAMCTGYSPFRADSTIAVLRKVCESRPTPVREVRPETPRWMEAIIDRLHAKDPDDRFQTAGEVAEVLSRHLDDPRPRSGAVKSPKRRESPLSALHPASNKSGLAASIVLTLILGLVASEAIGLTRVRGQASRAFRAAFRIDGRPGGRPARQASGPAATPTATSLEGQLAAGLTVDRTPLSTIRVRGKVLASPSGDPVAGAAIQYQPRVSKNPHFRRDFRPEAVGSGPAGDFQIDVLPGPGYLTVDGPGTDFILQEFGANLAADGRPGGSRLYTHALIPLDLEPGSTGPEVAATLRVGGRVRGEVVRADGSPATAARLFSRLNATCERRYRQDYSRVLPDGRFELSGCDPGQPYRVVIVDEAGRQGIATELPGGQAADEALTIRLELCSPVGARFLTDRGKPVAGLQPLLTLVLAPGPSQHEALFDRRDLLAAEEIDWRPTSSPATPRPEATDAGGRTSFPMLVSGATYRVNVLIDGFPRLQREFTAGPGITPQILDVVVRQ